jgi:hypothetical protein
MPIAFARRRALAAGTAQHRQRKSVSRADGAIARKLGDRDYVNLVHGKRWSVAAERDFAPSYLMRKKRVVFAKPRRANVSSKLMLQT